MPVFPECQYENNGALYGAVCKESTECTFVIKWRHMKNFTIALIAVIIFAVGAYFLLKQPGDTVVIEKKPDATDTTTKVTTTTPLVKDEAGEGTVAEEEADLTKTVIGTSVGGSNITAYHYGSGEKEILFIGGIHGGYEWNTVLLAYELMDYLDKNPNAIPQGERVTVIPVLNPDGLKKVVGTDGRFTRANVPTDLEKTIPGRFNGNAVDLNRNFDCEWQATGKWQDTTVSGGNRAFSEPESQAIQSYVTAHTPSAVVVWYSAAGGVYSSSCHNDVSPETKALTATFAKASGYPGHESFDFYAITGDMVNWFAKNNIPAISVLLTNHTDTEWAKNQAGVNAVLKQFAQ